MGRTIPLETVGSYKPDGFLNIFRVGLILPISGDVARGGSSDRRRASISHVDRVTLLTFSVINRLNHLVLIAKQV